MEVPGALQQRAESSVPHSASAAPESSGSLEIPEGRLDAPECESLHFALNLSRSGIAEHLAHLDLALEQASLLRSLEINLCKTQVQERGPVVSQAGYLQRLSINFSDCKHLSDSGVALLCEGVEQLAHLLHLDLRFKRCRSLLPWCNCWAAFHLQHLCLVFSCCVKISDTGASSLAEAARQLAHLQHLRLSFTRCSWISAVGVASLAEGLRQLGHLHHLHLGFSHFSRISNVGASTLGEAVRQLPQLLHLHLDF